MPRSRILVLDAEQTERRRLRDALAEQGFEAVDAETCGVAIAWASSFRPDALLASLATLQSPGSVGAAAFIAALRSSGSDAAVVLVVRPGETESAVEALRRGAASYLPAPVSVGQAAEALQRAVETQRLRREAAQLRVQVSRQQLVGAAPEIEMAREVIRRAAPTKATFLIQGESGTGRNLAAQNIHESSPRRGNPFIRASCAGLSDVLIESELFGHEPGAFPDATGGKGRVAAADGGTLFLHEVASLPPSVQVKLLHLLQYGEYERMGGAETLRADVRVVASTSCDLAEQVRMGRFRDDLYYRLGVVSVALPPLRKRKRDIPALVELFLGRSAQEHDKPDVRGVSPGALSMLYAYDWPGNVRELAAAIKRAVIQCDGAEVTGHHLSPVLQGGRDDRAGSALIPGATLSEIEREAILRTLEEAGGSTVRAAEILGISVRKIQYKLRAYRDGCVDRRRRSRAAMEAATHRASAAN